MGVVTPFPTSAGRPSQVAFERREFDRILDLYGRMVAAGHWRDYALEFGRDAAVFAAFRRTAERPEIRIEKRPALRQRQGMWALVSEAGAVLRRGHELGPVLAPIERRLLKLVDKGGDGGDGSREALTRLAEAYADCLLAESWPVGWTAADRHAWAVILIERSGDHPGPPIFHHRLASMHSTGIVEILDRAAAQLEPMLADAVNADEIGAGRVLLLLLLRDSVTGIDQARISRLHRDWFARLRFDDLAIPYNLIFEKTRFGANRADLQQFADQHRDAILAGGKLPLAHLLFVDWITNGALSSGGADAMVALARQALADDNATEHDRLAAQSILARHDITPPARSPTVAGDRALRQIGSRAHLAINAARSIAGRHVPALHLFRRKPKVAFCVSGQLRGYEQALGTWYRNLLPGTEPHVFVDTWRRIGRSGAEPFRYVLPFEGEAFVAAYRKICHDMGMTGFTAHYPTLFRRLASTGLVEAQALSDAYDTPHVRIDDEDAAPFNGWSNQQKMHNKIESSFAAAMQAGGDYDLIVRLRPDKPVRLRAFDWRDMARACADRPILFADTAFGMHYAAPMMGDQCAIAAPEVMARYAATATLYPPLAERGLLSADPQLTGHTSVAYICWLNGIEVRKVPIRFGALAETRKLSVLDISQSLQADAAGRDDAADRTLLAASADDLKRA